MSNQELSYETFVREHKPQLEKMGLPESLWRVVWVKAYSQHFDVSKFFDVQLRVGNGVDDGYELSPKVPSVSRGGDKEGSSSTTEGEGKTQVMKAGQDVYLLPHVWTFEAGDEFAHLTKYPALVKDMLVLLDVNGKLERELERRQLAAKVEKQREEAAEIDPEMVKTLCSAVEGLSLENAQALLKEHHGDVVSAIAEAQNSDLRSEQNSALESKLSGLVPKEPSQSEAKLTGNDRLDRMNVHNKWITDVLAFIKTDRLEKLVKAVADEKKAGEGVALTAEEKVAVVTGMLFKSGLVRSYHVMGATKPGESGPAGNSIRTMCYVHDHYGSSLRFAAGGKHNAMIAPLVLIKLGVSISVFWLVDDVEVGGFITVPPVKEVVTRMGAQGPPIITGDVQDGEAKEN